MLVVLAGCSKSPEQQAKAACPFIIATPDGDRMARLKLLTDQGVAADEASKKLEQYESLIETKAPFDHSDLCSASVAGDQVKADRIYRQSLCVGANREIGRSGLDCYAGLAR